MGVEPEDLARLPAPSWIPHTHDATYDIRPDTVPYVLNDHEQHTLDVDETVRMIRVATPDSVRASVRRHHG